MFILRQLEIYAVIDNRTVELVLFLQQREFALHGVETYLRNLFLLKFVFFSLFVHQKTLPSLFITALLGASYIVMCYESSKYNVAH